MKRPIFSILFSISVLFSCNSDKNEKPETKIDLDFKDHKELLDAILLLPDSVFSSWEWKLEERKRWYNEIKANNFYLDSNPDFFNQVYFTPNSAMFSIVDGLWSISRYKASDKTAIIITDDMVGDGNDICIYEVGTNCITRTLDVKQTFGDYMELIKRADGKIDCFKKYDEDELPVFSFDFSQKQKVEIESTWYLLKDDFSECLKGNSLEFNFNPAENKFELLKVSWKEKKNN